MAYNEDQRRQRAAAVAPQPDLMEKIKGLIDQFKPQPFSADVQAPDLDVMRDSLDRARQAQIVHGALGTRTPNWYQIQHGGKSYTPDTPISQAVQQQALQPMQEQEMKFKYGAERAKLGLDAAKANNAIPLAEMKGLLGGVTTMGRQNIAAAGLQEHTDHDIVTEDKKATITGKPPNKAEGDQLALLSASADHLENLKGVVGRRGTLGTLTAKIGPWARAGNVIGGVIPGAKPDADTQAMLDDLALGESSMKGLLGTAALGTEPRRIAESLQREMNQQIGEGTSSPVFTTQAGLMGQHLARNYREHYMAHEDYYKNRPDVETPDEYESRVMSGLTAPASAAKTGGKAPAPAGAAPRAAAPAKAGKKLVKTQTNKATGKKRNVYDDGSTEDL